MSLGENDDHGRRLGALRALRVPDLRWAAGLGVGLAAILVLAVIAAPMSDYWQNFALNTAADLIGAVFTIFVITPIIERAGNSRVREHTELDYSLFLDRAQRSVRVLRIMDTFSNLLIEPLAPRFEAMVHDALARGVSVRILLINPTTLAAEQRELELGQTDDELRPMLERNLETLNRLRHAFEEAGGPRGNGKAAEFQVRLYSSGPDITLYRWDDRALVSFFPVGRLSGSSTQLEVSVDSPLGAFVNRRFQDKWRSAAPFQALTAVTLADDRIERTYLVRFIDLDGERYVTSKRIARFLNRSVGAVVTHNGGAPGGLEPVGRADGEGRQLCDRLDRAFRGIYGEVPDTPYLRLDGGWPSGATSVG
jgi:hypothetical protein